MATKKSKGRPRKYPWDEWIDGRVHTLVRGVHFDCSIPAFVVLCHRQAKKNELTVRTRKYADNKTINISFK